MKMEQITAAPTDLAQLQKRIYRSQRTLVAEAQRAVLHSGRDIVAHCLAVAGPEGAKFAEGSCNMILCSRMPPESWPLSGLLDLLARTPPASGCAPAAMLLRDTFDRLLHDIGDLTALRVLHESVTAESGRKREKCP